MPGRRLRPPPVGTGTSADGVAYAEPRPGPVAAEGITGSLFTGWLERQGQLVPQIQAARS